MPGFWQWEMRDLCMPNLGMFVMRTILTYIEIKIKVCRLLLNCYGIKYKWYHAIHHFV